MKNHLNTPNTELESKEEHLENLSYGFASM